MVDYEDIVAGLITIEIESENYDDFTNYWNNLKPSTETRNRWLKPFWEDYFNCNFTNRNSKVTNNICGNQCKQLNTNNVCPEKAPNCMSTIFSKIEPTINAVYAYADALDTYLKAGGNFSSQQGNAFFQTYLSHAKMFDGSSMFDEKGDFAQPKYAVYQYQHDNSADHASYKKVGLWFNRSLSFEMKDLKWNTKSSASHLIPPVSSCPTKCGSGKVLETDGGVCCSGKCKPCKPYEYKLDDRTCMDCQEYGEWNTEYMNETTYWVPTVDQSSCKPPSDKVLTPISTFLSSWGITFTLISLYAFLKHFNTPIVKNSSKEHCIIILAGLLFVFFSAFIAEVEVNSVSCGLLLVIPTLGFCMMYSAIFVKLYRLHRIFQGKMKSPKSKHRSKSLKPFQPTYVGVYSTMWITAGLVCIQIVISMILMINDPPNPMPIYPERKNDNLKKCHYLASSYFFLLLYFFYNYNF